MRVESGTFARSSTGSPTYLLNDETFTPSLIIFWVTGKTSADTESHSSWGVGHGAFDTSASDFMDTTGGKSVESNSKVISHWSRVTGTITEKIAATLTSISAGEWTMNFTAADVNYNIHFLAIGD